MTKYNILNQDTYNSHMKILSYIDNGKKVLDVGCSTGKLAKKIQEKNCEVVGIEIDTESAQLADKYCEEVIIGNIENIKKIDYPKKYFDYIIFGDILEHLKYPEKVIRRLKYHLSDEGVIIVSLPNVANWVIRIKLLFGYFEYKEVGILDKTHLRFYNEKSSKLLLEKNGYTIISFDLVPSKFPFLSRKWDYKISKIKPNLFAIQFLIIAKKSG